MAPLIAVASPFADRSAVKSVRATDSLSARGRRTARHEASLRHCFRPVASQTGSPAAANLAQARRNPALMVGGEHLAQLARSAAAIAATGIAERCASRQLLPLSAISVHLVSGVGLIFELRLFHVVAAKRSGGWLVASSSPSPGRLLMCWLAIRSGPGRLLPLRLKRPSLPGRRRLRRLELHPSRGLTPSRTFLRQDLLTGWRTSLSPHGKVPRAPRPPHLALPTWVTAQPRRRLQ